MAHTDLTFITNEEQQNFKERFWVFIKDAKFFDCLVRYFYTVHDRRLVHKQKKVLNPYTTYYVSADMRDRRLKLREEK